MSSTTTLMPPQWLDPKLDGLSGNEGVPCDHIASFYQCLFATKFYSCGP